MVFNEFGVDILKCRNCGHVFSTYECNQFYDGYFDQQNLETEDQFYWNVAHNEMYNDFCKRFILNRNGKLLDVGCGMGYFVKHVAKYAGWEVWGCEISEHAVCYAKRKLGLTNIISGKIEEANFCDQSFDIITLWDVIEHIPNPDPFLAKINQFLKPGGLVFLHTPNVNIQLPKAKLKRFIKGMNPKIHYLEAKDHVNIYSEKTISTILLRNGFENIDFIHLKPIQSVSGSKNILFYKLKDAWAAVSGFIYAITFKRLNIGNLFITAQLKNQMIEERENKIFITL
jgi:2-polyprenyl-3-methyl-5-hydroxy-6-metoxy-1,4-benzoquinol methylase